MRNDDLALAISELANTVQILVGLATDLRRSLGAANEAVAKLDAAVGRAARALQRLPPREDR